MIMLVWILCRMSVQGNPELVKKIEKTEIQKEKELGQQLASL